MRFFLALTAAAVVFGGVAHAQTTATSERGYVEGVAQSAFGNVTTQSYGAEVGVTVAPNVQVFGEFGQIKTVASAEFTAAANKIAVGLAPPVQPAAVGFTAKQPVTFFGGGVPLYSGGQIVGGLGISGDTSCADHEVAKRVRHLAHRLGRPRV